jgi:hypothetical protein
MRRSIPLLPLLLALTLTPAAGAVTLTGTVVDEARQPVAGAEVTLVPVPDPRRGPQSGEERPQARSGKDGRFRFPAAPAGMAYLQIRHPSFADVEALAVLVPEAGSDLGALTLGRGALFRGQVVDVHGRPNPGVEIRQAINGRTAVQSQETRTVAVTGSDGSFAVAGFRPGQEVKLRAGRLETAFVWIEGRAGDPEPVRVALPMTRSSAAGRVLSPTGVPMADAMVSAYRIRDPEVSAPFNGVRTDAAGRFLFEALPEGRYNFWVFHQDFDRGSLLDVPIAEGQRVDGLTLLLTPAGAVAGRVVSPEGKAIPGALLALNAARQPLDAEGRFHAAVPAGTPVSLYAEAEGYTAVNRIVWPGDDVEIVLAPQPVTEVRGRVLGPDGRPVAGAGVGPYGFLGRTAADGTFAVKLPPGNTEDLFQVRKPGFAPVTVPASAWRDGASIEVRLEAGATITGRISGLSAIELTRVQIDALTADPDAPVGESVPGTTDGRGAFRIDHLAPGIWKVAAGLDGRFAEGKVTIVPGQTAVTFDLAVPATAPVQVCTPVPKGGQVELK